MIWAIVRVLGKQGITYLMFIVLAFFLEPGDFGILGMAMAWIMFIQAFSELGLGAALIQRKDVSERHYNSVFWMNIGLGIVLTIAGFFLSVPCALFFKTPVLRNIMAVLSLGFIINAFSLTQVAIAERELRYRDLAWRDIFSVIVGGVVGITMAWKKMGVWSLVVQSLTTYLCQAVWLWNVSVWRPQFGQFSFNDIRELWPYSSKIFAFNVLKYFAQNIDKLVIGYFLGQIALGYYVFAFKLMVFPVSIVVGAVGSYLFSRYSRLQDDLVQIRESYLFTVKAIAFLVLPLAVLAIVFTPVLLPILFQAKWLPAIILIRVFALLAIAQALISPVGQLMKALNRPDLLLNWSIGITLTVIIVIAVGTRWGILGAAVALTFSYLAAVPLNYFWAGKLLRIKAVVFIEKLKPLLMPTAAMTFYVIIFSRIRFFPDLLRACLGLTGGIILYLLLLGKWDKIFFRQLRLKIQAKGEWQIETNE